MTIAMRHVVKFPANVQATKGIDVSRISGTFTFKLNYENMTPSDSVSSNVLVAFQDPATGAMGITTLSSALNSNANIQAIAGATTDTNKLGYWDGASSYALTNFPTFGRTLIGNSDATGGRATLGVVIGTDVQAYSPNLDGFSDKIVPSGDVVGSSDGQTLTNKTINGANNTITNIANTSITGLGTAATANVGTSAGNVVQLDGSAKLPAIDGSQLTNLPAAVGGLAKVNNLSDVTNTATSLSNIGGMGVSTYDPAGIAGNAFNGFPVATRTSLSALNSTKFSAAHLVEAGREGQFVWNGSNLSAKVTLDTQQGIYVPPSSDTTGASGCWVRSRSVNRAPVTWFGAKGDGITVAATVSITSGTKALTATGASFVSGDVGKIIFVPGAGAAGAVLQTTISAVTDATHVTVADNAGTTLSASSKTILYATDDSAAFQAALDVCKDVIVPYVSAGYVVGGVTMGIGTRMVGERGIYAGSQNPTFGAQMSTIVLKGTSSNYGVRLTPFVLGTPVTVSDMRFDGTYSDATAVRAGTADGAVIGVELKRLNFYNCLEAIGDETSASNYIVEWKVESVDCNLPRGRQIYSRRSGGIILFRSVKIDHTNNSGNVPWEGARFEGVAGIELDRFDVIGNPNDATNNSSTFAIVIAAADGYNASVWLDRVLVDTWHGQGVYVENIYNLQADHLSAGLVWGTSITLKGCTWGELSNVFVYGAKNVAGAPASSQGYRLDGCSNITTSNLNIKDCTGQGYALNNSTSCKAHGGAIRDNTLTGILEAGTSNANLNAGFTIVGNGSTLIQAGSLSATVNYINGSSVFTASTVGAATIA